MRCPRCPVALQVLVAPEVIENHEVSLVPLRAVACMIVHGRKHPSMHTCK